MYTGKLDKRHSGHAWFKFYAEFWRSENKEFVARRAWCWEQFGPSSELEFYHASEKASWCWVSSHDRIRLYFAEQKQFSQFLLKWT